MNSPANSKRPGKACKEFWTKCFVQLKIGFRWKDSADDPKVLKAIATRSKIQTALKKWIVAPKKI